MKHDQVLYMKSLLWIALNARKIVLQGNVKDVNLLKIGKIQKTEKSNYQVI